MNYFAVSVIAVLFISIAPQSSLATISCINKGHLFHIASNCNPNVVNYDVCLDSGNNISAHDPVTIYWVSLNGKSYELNFIEKMLAYGLNNVTKNGGNSIEFSVAALKDTTISVAKLNGQYRAIINLGNGEIVIDRVYVNATNRILGIPKVNWVDIIGRKRLDSKTARERITPR